MTYIPTRNAYTTSQSLYMFYFTHASTETAVATHISTSNMENSSLVADNKPSNNGQVDMPFFYTEEGRYLASCKYISVQVGRTVLGISFLIALGDPLIKGLTEVANKRPQDPIAYLATYLYNFANNSNNRVKTQVRSNLSGINPELNFFFI